MKTVLSHFVLLILFSTQVSAADAGKQDLFSRYLHYYSNYQLNADGTHIETHDWALKILRDAAIAGAKQTSITYSTSVQKAEVLEAYTLKADGRRIDAPKTNYQLEENRGKDKNSPVFSDLATLTVVFPDVSVGDTVVFAYKLTQTEAIFPKHFSTMQTYSTLYPYDDVRIRIEYPATLWVHYEARQFNEKNSEENGRKTIEWTYQNKDPIKSKRRDYSVYDVEKTPGFIFSTFKTNADIAEAYGVRARPKAAVTERLQKLADEITEHKKVPRDQAHALYDWVATNISYAGNCIGVGAVVPHDIPFILDNKMGDCKDHATLLQALLAAKGIPSTQALINAGNSYRLTRIPEVAMVNHVINYVPSLNLFLDSTSQFTPFGLLPYSDQDKPVLLVDGYTEGFKTPSTPPGVNQQHMKTTVDIKSDGSVSGVMEVDLKGAFAASARSYWRRMSKDHEDDLVENVIRSSGHIGKGSLHKDDPTALLDTYHYSANFEIQDFIQRPGSGAFYVRPFLPSEAPIHNFVEAGMYHDEGVDFACWNGTSTEEYIFRLPKEVTILSIPDNMTYTDNLATYQATYKLTGSTLVVKRIFEDRTPRNVCTPEIGSANRKFTLKVMPNLKSQVVYK